MNLIMTIKTDHSTFEAYTANPGEHFPGFGGSKSGLLVGKTASLIVRHYQHDSGSVEDTEHDIDSETAWSKIKGIMRNANSVE